MNYSELDQVVSVRKKLENYFGAKYSYFIETYGCAQNESDSEIIEGILLSLGFEKSEYKTKAEFVVLNSCAVRESAELKFLGKLGELKPLKLANKKVIIAVCGCMFARNETKELIQKSYTFIDIIGNANFVDQLVNMLDAFLENKKIQIAYGEETRAAELTYPKLRSDKYNATIPISYGCNNSCSYCIVPIAKGAEKSRPVIEIVKEFEEAVKDGYKCITLLGQNVNSYRNSFEGRDFDFCQLIKKLSSIKGDYVLSFLSSHPKYFTKELVDVIAENSRISKHIHLPLQSGCNNILKLMDRGYSIQEYMSLIDYAKRKIRNATFSSDIIVAFPGESDHEFDLTIEVLEEIKFIKLFTYIYSRRSGTKAANYEDDILQTTKTLRIEKLINTQKHITISLLSDFKKTKQRILIENMYKDGTGIGKMDNGIMVRFKHYGLFIDRSGQFAAVEITASTATDLEGILQD